ncbi:hypothetical protein AAF712_003556 [Marasmius tenuissimus]|uniref:Uncharacterized protein n=1 Tax=Marasmius tenuissimus TaxID=585030 RepID=A0ABR3A7M8_9AGAR
MDTDRAASVSVAGDIETHGFSYGDESGVNSNNVDAFDINDIQHIEECEAQNRETPLPGTTHSFDNFDDNLMIRDRGALHNALWTSTGEFSEDEESLSDVEDEDEDEEEL